MTELELAINMSKGTSNYTRLLRERAYQYCIKTNKFIKYIQEEIKDQRQVYKEHPTPSNILIDSAATYYSKKSKRHVHYTIYSKLPKFITYRQAIAITDKRLEQELKQMLHKKQLRLKYSMKGGE